MLFWEQSSYIHSLSTKKTIAHKYDNRVMPWSTSKYFNTQNCMGPSWLKYCNMNSTKRSSSLLDLSWSHSTHYCPSCLTSADTRCVLNPGGISCSPAWKLKRDFLPELHPVSSECDVPFQSAEQVTESLSNSSRLFGWTCHIGAIQQTKKQPSWQVKGTRWTFAQTEQFIFARDSVVSLYFTCHLLKITLQFVLFSPMYQIYCKTD